jgi:uncharacterized protein YbbC (DUF1343 family)
MLKRSLFWSILLLSSISLIRADTINVRLGIDVLKASNFEVLKDKKVGLVAHPASVNEVLVPTVDILRATDQCKLVALFGPEHGVYGDEYAGVQVADRTDSRTGLPIFSLYGKTRKPTPEMLKNLDALVFDLQDIGSRSYTYISSMKLCLEACADAGIDFVVLDRPNPLGGERIEGPLIEKGFESYVSALNVPYLHGMTMGELAQWVKEQVAPHYQKLHVVKMSGWRRRMTWEDTNLNWVPTSPHIPQASSCAAYAATGILGELGQISNGVGYPLPFELIGAPGIKAEPFAAALNDYWLSAAEYYQAVSTGKEILMEPSPKPEGLVFRAARFKPFYTNFKDQPCQGVQLFVNPKSAETLVELNFRVLSILDAPKLFKQASADQVSMFDKACGTDEAKKYLLEKRNLTDLFAKWKASCSKFQETREKFLLYE